MAEDKRQLKSYVWHDGKCYFISTIERDSSAAEAYGSRYMETMAWEYDWDSMKRGQCVAHTGDGPAFRQHMRVCEALYLTGRFDSEDE